MNSGNKDKTQIGKNLGQMQSQESLLVKANSVIAKGKETQPNVAPAGYQTSSLSEMRNKLKTQKNSALQ